MRDDRMPYYACGEVLSDVEESYVSIQEIASG